MKLDRLFLTWRASRACRSLAHHIHTTSASVLTFALPSVNAERTHYLSLRIDEKELK